MITIDKAIMMVWFTLAVAGKRVKAIRSRQICRVLAHDRGNALLPDAREQAVIGKHRRHNGLPIPWRA
uniref:hypothetical protein n=1 Tax=Cupriavidus taiwanensis TaxID=164546 RepID=UPI0018DBFDAD|nr:hypothetical protein [Cupriavidus taiwanensis]